MAYTCFDITTENHIAHIRLNRPEKRNAMNIAFWNELPEALREIDRSGTVRAVVISSTGPHFTAGIDLMAFAGLASNLGVGETAAHKQATHGLAFIENTKLMQDTFTAMEKLRVPVLCAIQGGCIGGGVDMVSAADMRYCTKDAYFTIYEINVGMTADVGTFPRILNHLPEGIVRELAYTGRKMSAEEALQFGLVNKIYETQEDMLAGVMAIATEIATKPPLAIHGIKNIVTYSRDHTTADALEMITVWNASMLQQSEIMEAMKVQQTKQPGNYAPLPPIAKVGG